MLKTCSVSIRLFASTVMNNRQRQRIRVNQLSLCVCGKGPYKGFLKKDCERGIHRWDCGFDVSDWPEQRFMNCDAIVPLAEADLSCPQEPVPTGKKVFPLHLCDVFSSWNVCNASSWECKNFSAMFERLFEPQVFPEPVFLVRHLGFARFFNGYWKPS